MGGKRQELIRIDPAIGGLDGIDRKIAALGRAQHRSVARRQLLRLGISTRAIEHRIRRGTLHPKYRGVYVLGTPALSVYGEWMCAVLACGLGATLSHRSAAEFWALLRALPRIHVLAPTARNVGGPVVCHRAADPLSVQAAVRASIPVTTIARTLADLAATEDEAIVRRAFREADRQKRLVFRELQAALGPRKGRKGSGLLVALIDAATVAEPTKSDFEEIWFDFCDAHDLPAPEMNATVAGYEVDASWPGTPLIVELDSWTWHGDRQAFENDRAKWEALQVAGYKVLPITFRRLASDPGGVAASVRSLLG